jgi:hypothetical protein
VPNPPKERRRLPRRPVLKTAKIIFRGGASMISCVVLDQTEKGARLKLNSALGIPHAFNLQITDEPSRPCEVVWRAGAEMGITYT